MPTAGKVKHKEPEKANKEAANIFKQVKDQCLAGKIRNISGNFIKVSNAGRIKLFFRNKRRS
jgi:hypothetical protein